MARARPPLSERLSAVNVHLRRSFAEDGGDRKRTVHTAAQPGISVHQGNKDRFADVLGKKNTVQQPLNSLNAANLSPQASGYNQSLHCSLTTNHSCELPDPFSYEVVSPTAALPTILPSSRSPSLSPLSPVSGQVEPPDLPDSNDDLWKEVMASGRPAAGSYARTQSSMKSTDQLSMMPPTNTPMFKWKVNGRIEELDYILHWLNSLKPENNSEKNRICELTVSGLQQLCVPPIRKGIGADFKRLANLTDLRWRQSISQNLFPLGSEMPGLFALLGDNDLRRLELPSKSPVQEPPDLVYSMTAEIFPKQYREDLKVLLFKEKEYAVPYLSIFLRKQRYGESTERMELWGVHMLNARVAEWCRACHRNRKLTKRTPAKLPSTAQTAKSSVSHARKSSTSRPTKPATDIPASSEVSTSAKVQPEVDEYKRLEGAPCHYSIALEHTQYSVWKFESDLRMTSNGIERRGVKCTQFKENSILATDVQWDELARHLLGIHLDAANQTGVLVKGAVTMMRSPSPVIEDLPESVAGDVLGNGAWLDQDHWVEARREDWTSALNDE